MTTRQDVFSKLKANPKLPTPSRTAIEILRLCRSETPSLSEITQVIQVDPALSAEVLKFANSAFLATGTQIASIQNCHRQQMVITCPTLILLQDRPAGLT